jgi:hypothetical protein
MQARQGVRAAPFLVDQGTTRGKTDSACGVSSLIDGRE